MEDLGGQFWLENNVIAEFDWGTGYFKRVGGIQELRTPDESRKDTKTIIDVTN